MRRCLLVPLFALFACASCRQDAPPVDDSRPADRDADRAADRAAGVIEEKPLREAVTYLASDALEGRSPGSPGDRLAREYLAKRLGELGYRPAGEQGGWQQPFSIIGTTSRMPREWTFTAEGGATESFRLDGDYVASTGVQRRAVSISDAEVVFVGYGVVAPEERWDDFKGAKLEGKLLLMLNDDPDWDPALFGGERKLYYGRWTYKYESAARVGAAGAIIIHTTASAGYSWDVVRTSNSGPQFEVPAGDEPRIRLQAWMTEAAATRLVSLGGKSLAELRALARSRTFRPVSLGVRTSLSFEVDIARGQTANVAGLLEGSDPVLREQTVAFTAHHDHLGMGEPDVTGDRIYNGALDNGVAMAQALGVAQAFAALPKPPRRSVLILFVAAEEQGLLGSKHFVEHPTVSGSGLAANINFELGNVWGKTRDIVVYGKGKSTLEDLLAARARAQGRVLVAEKDVRAGWYYRSDQFSFARAGTPALWFKSGTDFLGREKGWGDRIAEEWISRHYHRPSDEVEDGWDFAGLVEDARLGFLLGLDVANAEERPRFYPGDEFEGRRERAR